jgi:hypothetical protein
MNAGSSLATSEQTTGRVERVVARKPGARPALLQHLLSSTRSAPLSFGVKYEARLVVGGGAAHAPGRCYGADQLPDSRMAARIVV